MQLRVSLVCAMLAQAVALCQAPHVTPKPIDPANHEGWVSLFDGKTLDGWDGDPKVWRVADGAIIGQYDPAPGARNGQTFLILKDKEPGDFEMVMDVKIEGTGADSGLQFRSYRTSPGRSSTPGQDSQWFVGGYQFDLDFVNNNNGLVGESSSSGRGVIATRGQLVHTQSGKPPELTAELAGDPRELAGYVKINDWNHIHLIARDHMFVQIINGHLAAMLIDDDEQHFKTKGLIALQCAGRGQVKLSFRDLWLKELDKPAAQTKP